MSVSTVPTTIPVGDDYDVVIGSGVLDRVGDLLGADVERVLVVHPPTLPELASRLTAALNDLGYAVHVAEVPDAEAAKTSTVVCVPTSKPASVARNAVRFDSTDWRRARTRAISEITPR